MSETIAHTAFEWSRWRRSVVLFKRLSLKPLWGLCIFIAFYLSALAALALVLILVWKPPDRGHVHPLVLLGVAVIALLFAMAFVKVFKSDEGLRIPVRHWRVGRGVQLGCAVYRLPQPTSMGGTLPGGPTRWLVVIYKDGKQKRIAQVYHELDLFKVNLALAAS